MNDVSNVEAVRSMTNKQMVEAIILLQAQVKELMEKSSPRNEAAREMTEADARSILMGDLKDTKHKDAAAKLGLSYGQVYSCRLEHTFKAIHKEMKDAGTKNQWVK